MVDDSLRVIGGPTAAGKSMVAMWLAQRHRAAIVSADSRQVYRAFDIGTAKPTRRDRECVPHFGVDVLEPTARYSAAAWAADARRWMADATAAGHVPLLVGGTGFYLRALVEPVFDQPALDSARRDALGAVLAAMPVAELRRWCSALDPARAHLGRAQLLRAIEIALLTGSRMSDLHRRRPGPPRRTARYLLVDPGSALGDRVVQRTDAMLAAGWLDEVRALAGRVPAEAPAWKATGYHVLRAVARGAESLERARARVIVATRQYAKRQRTWFRHQLPDAAVTPLDPERPDWREVADRWWRGDAEE